MYPWKWFILAVALLTSIYFVPPLGATEAVKTGQELIADRGDRGWRGHRYNRRYDNWGSRYYYYNSTPSYYYRRTYYYPNGYYYSDPYYYYYPERRSGVYFRFGW